jgi:lysophospholipase L1-like esterase
VDILGRLLGCETVNAGENGREIPRYSWELAEFRNILADVVPFDLLVIMLGTNDLLQGNPAAAVVKRMEDFLIKSEQDPGKILLIAPPVLQFGEWVMDEDILEESELLGDEYRALAERKGCLFADAGKWGIELTFDGVHFSPEGHITCADRLNDLLKGDKIRWKNQ